MKKLIHILFSLTLVLFLLPIHGLAETLPQHSQVQDTTLDNEQDDELWNVINPLNTTVTFLNTGAHPDDERSDLLAYLSRGLGVKTSSVIANRGEGGQNEIGSELGDGLGIIRSNEMVEAADITGVKAYHLSETTSDSIYDFGFSKSPEETLEKWDADVTYERFIRFLREYQPDIVMPSFRDVENQHGHHRAMAILSVQAFEDAADPTVYPEQLDEGLSIWQTKKLYLPAESEETATTSIEIGDYDPIYDMSYPQLGEASRYLHKSQGMGNDIPIEPRQTHLELINSSIKDNQLDEDDLFAGIPYDFNDWSELVTNNGLQNQLTDLQQKLDTIVDTYPHREDIFSQSHQALKDVHKIMDKTEKSKLDTNLKNDLLHKLEIKEEQLNEVSLAASDLDVQTTMDSDVVTQGEKTNVSIELTNNGTSVVKHIDASIIAPNDWWIDGVKEIKKIQPGETKTLEFNVEVPEDAALYHPYDEPILQSKISLKERGKISTNLLNLADTVAVLPDISLTTNPENIVMNTADLQDEYPVSVDVKNYTVGEKDVSVSIELPEGWTSEPSTKKVNLDNRFDTEQVEFSLTPPENIEDGEFDIMVNATSNGKEYDTSIQEITYDHINNEYFGEAAQIHAISFELLKPNDLKVGYIESGLDEVADYLSHVGFDITKSTE